MAYIIEARDGIVNVDAGEKVLTLSESLLPKLASGSSYVVVIYNVTTGETTSFQEGAFIGSKELAISSSTLDPGTWKLGILGVLPSDLNNALAYWDDARFPNLTPPEGISITKRLTSTEIAALGINPSDFSFNLINTKADYKPPSVQVSSIQLSDKVLNVDAGEKLLKLDFSVTDDKSKLDFINITFRNDAAQAEKELSYYPQTWNGWDRANFSILSDFSWAAPGTWYPVDVYAQDTSGNEISYNKDGFDDQYEASTLLSAGININSITFSVINKNADTTKPVLTLSSPQLSDNIINVDQGEITLFVNGVVVDTGSGFQDLSITWRNVVSDASFNIWKDSVSIDSTGKFTIQQDTSGLSAGDWVVDYLSISDKAENTLEYSIDDFQSNTEKQKLLSAGIDIDKLAFKVINSNVINGNSDITAPLLTISASEISDGILDAAIGEKALTLQGMVSDDKSGFSNLYIQFVNQGTSTTRSFSISPSDLDDQGAFHKSIDFSWAANGTWLIQFLNLYDNARNALNYYRSADPGSLSDKSKLLAAGIDVDKFTFEVRKSVQDITPPRISLASPQLSDKVIDVNAGEKLVTFSGKIQEQGSGFENLSLSFQNQTDKTIRSLYVRGDSLQSDGSFTTTIDFSWASQGQWRLSSLWGSDKAGNGLQYYMNNDSTSRSLTSEVAYKKALLNSGLDIDALAFNVINSNSDIAPPVISGLSAPEIADQILDARAGETLINLQGSITDNKSGFSFINITYSNLTTDEQKSLWLSNSDLGIGGKFSKILDFSGASEGTWSIQNVYLADAAQNSISYYHGAYDSEIQKQRLRAAGIDVDNFEFNLVSNSTPAPTYSLTPSASSINEVGTLTTSISTTGVASGTTLYYGLSGTGITTSDFSSGALTGQVTVGTNGLASFLHILANDLTTEGSETLQIKLFSDSARTIQVGSTASVTIADTSTTPAPTYSLSTSAASINEGATLTTTATTTNVASGTTLYYSLSGTGISSTDFSAGSLTGQGTVGTDGKFSFSHTLANDLTTEGSETLQIKLFSDAARTIQVGSTASVTIADTSTTPAPTYTLSTSAASLNEGATLTTTASTSNVASGTTLYYSLSGTGITATDFSAGSLTGSGTVGADGKFSFSHTVAIDLLTEGDEGLEIKLYTDADRKLQVVSTATVTLKDTSLTPASTYVLTPMSSSINEGATLTTWVQTSNLTSGTTLFWSVGGTGINASDFSSGALTGSGVVGTDGKFSFSHTAANDLVTEGDESLEIKLYTDADRKAQVASTASVTIKDTSTRTVPKSQWLNYSGQATDEWSGGIATFSNGDIATAFSVSKANGASSVIVQRLSLTGSIIWSLDIGADYAPGAGSVLVGADDKVYVTGGTKKGATGESGLNDSDIFAAAISSTGQKLWYKNYGIGIHEIGSTAVLDANGNILLEGRVSEVNDAYAFIKDVPNFYGAEYSSGWRGFQLRINPSDGSVSKAYTTGSGNSGGGPIAIDRTRNISFVTGYTFGAVNGVNTVGNGDPNGANNYVIARNEATGAILWTRMENWMRSNVVSQESENAIYLVNKGNLEKINGSTGQTIWSKPLTDTNYVLSPITGGGVLLSESESNGTLTIRRFDSNGTETGSQAVSHTGKLYPRSFIEQGDGTIRISGSTSDAITVPTGTIVTSQKQSGNDSFVLQVNSSFSTAPKVTSPIVRGNSLYTIVDGPSWTQAEANSVKLGGHLATISGTSENTFLNETFRNNLAVPDKNWNNALRSGAWIGLTDPIIDGQWSWISGESYGYNNSALGQNGVNGVVDGKVLLMLDPSGEAQRKGGLGTWWDSPVNAPSLYNNWLYTKGIAETPFIRRGDSAYVVVQGPTWEEAEVNAVKLGGHLVTINDAAENEWLVKTYPLSPNFYVYWTGLNDAQQEGSFSWISGETSTYTNWRPLSGPNRPAYNKETDLNDYIVLQTNDLNESKAGQWSELDNTYFTRYGGSNLGIAEIKLAPNNTPTGTPTLSGTTKVGQVITIDRTPLQDADNFTGYTPDYKFSFEVSNNNGTTWTKLTSTDATDNNSTYTLTAAEVGKSIRGVVSYLDGYGTNESVASLGSSVSPTAVVRGNSLYTIVDGPSWTQAEANSVKLGGHLVTINDAAENEWVANLTTQQSWIGFTDTETEGNWKWVDGSSSTYTNWYLLGSLGAEPNNGSYLQPGQELYLGGEDYAFLYKTTDTNKWGDGFGQHDHGDWLNKGIAETTFIRRGDSAYVIVQGPTWEEAEANAVKLGGHLVTVNDAEENSFLVNFLNKETDLSFYIGATDKEQEGVWKDPTGNLLTYTNWHTWQGGGEPNNNNGGEDFGVIYSGNYAGTSTNKGKWNDISFIKEVTNGIAEIKLAPNNTPTGTPSVTGTLKVGSTLTIDATAIKDSDNFTGYTPTLKYNWETSTDGTTWSKLTSTDGADNNNTYILTSTETYKKIRGVVSYLDGYGTNEVVPSTASAPITSSAPPVQSLTLTPPSKTAIRSGISTTSAIAYNVSTGETALTGIGASLYFDSTQLSVNTAGDPFKTGLLGNAISADTTNADGDPKTDKILALTYADFGGNFPGTGTTLPLTLANLNLVPTTAYSGTTLHLQGTPAVGFTATGADLTLGYNSAPTVTGTLTNKTINRGSAFTYTVPSGLFTDADSTLTISAKTATGAALPSWLTFNATTGTFTGTPTSGGTFNLSVAAADELGSVSAPLTLNVREVQSVSSSATDIRYQRNKDVTVPINYSTTDGSQTTGMSFKVHYNSSLFSFDPVTGVSNKATADLFQIGAVQSDTSNTDGDASTDKFIPINVASFSGSFPSGATPIKLADLIFKAADKAIDPLTGLKDTKINFSETEAAQGYGFQGTGASLKPMSFNLDVDGDGKVTALGDGLMVIRHLFGSAFSGSGLTDKAISPTSPFLGGATYNTMTAEQKNQVASLVATNIQQGIDAGLLDVDKDGKTTALGDGLMVIRNLFGSAFSGTALIDKAISPTSPFLGGLTYATMSADQKLAASGLVTATIDALRPTVF